jgi:glycosyltransferase involved in cell wall biosynthesis
MNEDPLKDLLVSVIIPAYNAEKYLADAIDSILNQTFTQFEIIIIDDCSKDRTNEIIQKYANSDVRIRAFRNKINLGIAGNRNKGVGLAKGKYVVWQDADDISLPWRIEKQLHFMEINPEVGIVGGYLQFFSDDNENTGIRKYSADDLELRRRIFRFSPVAQPAAMIRKSCLIQAGEYDLKLPPAEDLDMSFRIGIRHKFANIQEVVIKYREHPNSATFTRLRKIELSTLFIRKKYSHTNCYKMKFSDRIYNFIQLVSIYVIPSNIKIYLFNLFRNS